MENTGNKEQSGAQKKFTLSRRDMTAVVGIAAALALLRFAVSFGGMEIRRIAIGVPVLTAFFLTLFSLWFRFSFLPVDQGRAFAVQGMASRGKIRGVGIIMMIAYLCATLLFLPFTPEYLLYSVLIFVEMMSGYLDDASRVAWKDYKKGAIDFGVSLLTAIVFTVSDSTVTYIGKTEIRLNPVVYVILGTILVWVSINATNCVDGVDGLCATLSIVTIASLCVIYTGELTFPYRICGYAMIAVLLAYLVFNTKPSSMLMGDAGSRAIGVLIAILVMKSRHPLCYIPLAIVMIVDGLTGLMKVFFKRYLHITLFRTLKTPIHDEMRRDLLTGEDTTPKPKKPKVRNWQDPQIVARFAIIQAAVSAIWYMLGL